MDVKVSPIALVVLAAILAGLLNLFSKDLLIAGLGSIEVCACREGVTAIVFGLILLLRDREAFRIRLRDVWIFILFAFFNVISNLCVFTAQEMMPLEVAAVLEMTSPYFILIFAFFLFGDKITRRKILAVILAFIGCIFIIGVVNGVGDIQVLGVVIGLMSGMTLAAFTLGSKIVEEKGYSENTAMFYFFAFSALMVAPLTNYGLVGATVSSNMIFLVYILIMGVLCTLTPNYLIIYSIRRVDPALVSIIITSSLIVSTLCGVLVFGDSFGWDDLIGIILVLAAITILDPPQSLKDRFDRLFSK